MIKVFKYLPFHFVIFVILGIAIQFYTQLWEFGFLKLLFIFVGSLFLLIVVRHKIFRTFLSFVLFFIIGISAIVVNNDRNYENNYKNYLGNNSTLILKVNKVLKSNIYHHKYEVEVIQVDSTKTKGKILLNISKDSPSSILQVDELIFTKSNFETIQKPLNPHQFDYKQYLEKQGIYQQLFLKKDKYNNLGIHYLSFSGLSAQFRNKVQASLLKYNFEEDELAVITALLLGQRQEISKELIANYSKAGAIHILAVSGLHVGILLWILSWVLKPIERIKKGKIIKISLIVLQLWTFAFIAGLSASVVRAVTMFTFLAIGLSFKRKNEVLFSLISSMFFLLIFKPMFVFDVGFQLSYLAVFGIIFMQPKLYAIYKPKFWMDKKIWEITSVSIAAQIGVLPLSLFYFHQFPGLFMLSNLVIIPFLGAILVGGILIIILALLGILPQVLATIYGEIIVLLNTFVRGVSQQEQFLFQEISISILLMLAVYVMIIYSFRFIVKRLLKRLTYVLLGIIILQTSILYENYEKNRKNEFIVFHKSRNSILGYRTGEKFSVYHDLDSTVIQNSNAIQSYRIGENVTTYYTHKIPNIFKFKNQQFLVIDTLGIYKIKDLENPIVILQQSPKINLERLIKTFSPKQIIADGSNYKSYVKRWQKTAVKEKTPFRYTGEKGAFIY